MVAGRLLWALCIEASLLMMHSVTAAVCPDTSEAPPEVVTLMRSKQDPENDVWVVKPDCTVETHKIGLNKVGNYVDTSQLQGIEYIASLPSKAATLYVHNQRLSRGADLSGEKITTVELYGLSADAYAKVIPPPAVSTLTLVDIPLRSVAEVRLGAFVTSLSLEGNGLSSFKTAPQQLTYLSLKRNLLSSIEFKIPVTLRQLILDGNSIQTLDRLVLPSTLMVFSCESCGLSTVRGIKWPNALRTLTLADNPIVDFEIRSSDLVQFKNAGLKVNSVTTCRDPTAKLTTFKNTPGYTDFSATTSLCVISDARFDELYGNGAAASESNGKDETSPTASSDSSSGSNADTSSTSTAQTASRRGSTSSAETDDTPVDYISESQSNAGSNSTRRKRTGSADPGTTQNSSDSHGSPAYQWVIVSVVVIVLAVSIAWYQRNRSRSVTTSKDPSQYSTVDTPSMSNGTGTHTVSVTGNNTATTSASGLVPNDIRDDAEFNAKHRVPKTNVKVGSVISQGGFGVVYRGIYESREVAIKQMLPNTWRDDAKLAVFMDEIRICASLDHPKIVQFIGIMWTSLRDMSAITEFMDGGDLYSLLQKQAELPVARDWFNSWTPNQIKSKASIALDIAEAIVYLHSYSPNPILHRDLKARNVLLDHQGNAKLSDFGISRKLSIDETMTGEVGTVAWIAPEVLRGERYSESADIYSLGVLLIELDSCRHPYDQETTKVCDAGKDMGSSAQQNLHIAMLVSLGELRPNVSSSCPTKIGELTDRCLSFHAEKRPSAMELRTELQTIMLES